MKRYVALGSSMAAGPGIRPRAAGAPRWSGRSARNYAHLVAARCGYDLVDVTFSGATTAHVLTERQHGAAPQIAALDGSESLVTVTIGGNDVGYIPLLTVAALPRPLRRLPLLGDRIAELLDAEARNRALEAVFESLCAVGTAVRQRCAEARIFFVDYLTMLPPAGVPAAPLSAADADLGRHVAATLERMSAPTPPRRPAAISSRRPRPAANTTPGPPTRGRRCRRATVSRYRAGPRRCTPMPPGCVRWRN
ncbi:hypothetical protein JPH1_47230 [Mycobacterium avium subsp. hominissuis]|uniref:SGNH hydrolase-type esterase domain-containing protein n=1 Tax=Mycobacterium avium subsp. hominissuis TaxID=439334 RepID=A0AAI8SS33_MYCAV|nr:hypothetical protein JPH1_47230 [Mycobacterium avium subsp. hominissuis]